MTARKPFKIEYTRSAKAIFQSIDRKHYGLIRSKLEEQLLHEPDVETTNRKPLRPPPPVGGATWELRFGPDNCFRVFYDFEPDEHLVTVYAIGIKQGNRLFIGGQECST